MSPWLTNYLHGSVIGSRITRRPSVTCRRGSLSSRPRRQAGKLLKIENDRNRERKVVGPLGHRSAG